MSSPGANKAPLSVAVITLNEERNIARCLRSVQGLADEIVVIDSGSTDRTEEICRSFGVRFETHEFEGHIQQKNHAVSRCTHELILALDADEVLSDQLVNSVREAVSSGTADAYAMNRCTNYCGTWIRHGAWYPDKKVRLFRRSKGVWTGTNPHDRFELTDKTSTVQWIAGDILHYSYSSIGDHLRQIDVFTGISARELAGRGRRASFVHLLFSPPARFVRDYFIRAGYLDGYHGFVIALLSAMAVFVKYARVRELNGKEVPIGT